MVNKKILFVTHLFFPSRGGVETHLKRLSQGLVERGYAVKVLTTNAYSTEAFFLNDKRRIEQRREIIDGVEVERLDFRTFGRRTLNLLRALACRFKYPFNEWIRSYSYGPRNPLYLKKIIEFAPDLILTAPLPTFNIYYAWKGAKKLGIPLIINPAFHIHDPCSYSNPVFFKIMREADLVAVHSEIEKKHIAQKGRINSNKILVFPPLPFEKEDFTSPAPSLKKEDIKKKYGIKQKFVLLFLGQHGRHKNIQGILKAMPRVWDHLSDVALVIAGGTTAFTPNLKKISRELNSICRQKVYFIDNFPQDEKSDIFDMADIFVCLSEFESFGIVFVEAMFHSLPVIASGFGVADSIIDNFRTGLLVNPNCDVEVAGAIIELLLDKDIRKIYGENGRLAVLNEYDPEIILERWEKILAALLGQNHPPNEQGLDR